MSWTHRSPRVLRILYLLGHGLISYTATSMVLNALVAWLGLDECIKNMSPDTARAVKLSSSTISYSSRNVVATSPRNLILAIGPADSIILPYLSRDELSNYTNHHPISGFTCRSPMAESCPQPSALLDLSAETGQLHNAGQQVIMAEEDQGHLTLAVPPGTISTTYQVMYGMLEWYGDGFEGKQLQFCRDVSGRVFAHVGQVACLPIFITVSEASSEGQAVDSTLAHTPLLDQELGGDGSDNDGDMADDDSKGGKTTTLSQIVPSTSNVFPMSASPIGRNCVPSTHSWRAGESTFLP